MLDELAIYNLSVKYPNTIDLVREVERIAKAEAIDEIRSKMVSFHTDAIFRYGVDIIEGRADAFNDLEKWLKEQNNE